MEGSQEETGMVTLKRDEAELVVIRDNQPPHPVALLAAGVPLTLLLDLASPEGPDSRDLMRHEGGCCCGC